jgi:secreted trypsin-like serine protease
LFLKTDAKFTETVDTICLPSQDQPIDMSRCFATGWGKNKFGKDEKEKAQSSYAKILKKVEVPTVQHADCQNKMRRTRLGRRFVLDSSFMCAGGEEGIDTCKGDGGSPLVCPVAGVQNKYYQAGIVAWGMKELSFMKIHILIIFGFILKALVVETRMFLEFMSTLPNSQHGLMNK